MSSSSSTYKVILIGDCKVGKTSFLYRATNKSKNDTTPPPTIGVEYVPTTIGLHGKSQRVDVWDTTGAEQYRSITAQYYRKCHGVILMFDITNYRTFESLRQWNKEIDSRVTIPICKSLVGNKVDLLQKSHLRDPSSEKDSISNPQRQVSEQEITNFCIENQMTYKETSALKGISVQEALVELAEKIYENRVNPEPLNQYTSIMLDNNNHMNTTIINEPTQSEQLGYCSKCC